MPSVIPSRGLLLGVACLAGKIHAAERHNCHGPFPLRQPTEPRPTRQECQSINFCPGSMIDVLTHLTPAVLN